MHTQSRECHVASDRKRMAGVPFSRAQSAPPSQGAVSGLEPTRRKGKPATSFLSQPPWPVAGWFFLSAALILLPVTTTVPHFLTSL